MLSLVRIMHVSPTVTLRHVQDKMRRQRGSRAGLRTSRASRPVCFFSPFLSLCFGRIGRRSNARFLRPHQAVLDDGNRAKKRRVRGTLGAHDGKGASYCSRFAGPSLVWTQLILRNVRVGLAIKISACLVGTSVRFCKPPAYSPLTIYFSLSE